MPELHRWCHHTHTPRGNNISYHHIYIMTLLEESKVAPRQVWTSLRDQGGEAWLRILGWLGSGYPVRTPPVIWSYPIGTKRRGIRAFLTACPYTQQKAKRKEWGFKALSSQTSENGDKLFTTCGESLNLHRLVFISHALKHTYLYKPCDTFPLLVHPVQLTVCHPEQGYVCKVSIWSIYVSSNCI